MTKTDSLQRAIDFLKEHWKAKEVGPDRWAYTMHGKWFIVGPTALEMLDHFLRNVSPSAPNNAWMLGGKFRDSLTAVREWHAASWVYHNPSDGSDEEPA
jgi:hypothetical protein